MLSFGSGFGARGCIPQQFLITTETGSSLTAATDTCKIKIDRLQQFTQRRHSLLQFVSFSLTVSWSPRISSMSIFIATCQNICFFSVSLQTSIFPPFFPGFRHIRLNKWTWLLCREHHVDTSWLSAGTAFLGTVLAAGTLVFVEWLQHHYETRYKKYIKDGTHRENHHGCKNKSIRSSPPSARAA